METDSTVVTHDILQLSCNLHVDCYSDIGPIWINWSIQSSFGHPRLLASQGVYQLHITRAAQEQCYSDERHSLSKHYTLMT